MTSSPLEAPHATKMSSPLDTNMSSPLYYNQDSVTRFKKRKARFTFSEVHILLDEVRKHRHIVVGKFNRGVPTDTKKRTWAEITARVNEIGDAQREVIEIIKKWSDLKCDTKRKVAAMRSGLTGSHSTSISSRVTRDLTPTESIVHKILEMDVKRDPGESSSYDPLRMLGEDDELEEEEDMMGIHGSPDGGMDMYSMPPPPPSHHHHPMGMPGSVSMGMPGSISMGMPGSVSMGMPGGSAAPGSMPMFPSHNTDQPMPNFSYSASSRESSQPPFEMQYEIPPMEDTRGGGGSGPFGDSDDDHSDDLLPSANQSSNLAESHHRQGNGGLPKPSTSSTQPPSPPSSSSSSALPPPPSAQPAGKLPPPTTLRESMLQNATLSVQEQHATNVLLETVSRSLELLSESVQQLAETQQEFVRDSLQLQRETVQVLRDFTSGALALMHDKINGRPML